MELSKLHRTVLINQYRILQVLLPDEAKDYEELIEILSCGYTVFYDAVDQWVYDEMAFDECRLVLDTLSLYRTVEDYKSNNPDDTGLRDHFRSAFAGFDGNNESSYLGFTRFLIERQGKFSEQLQYKDRTDNFNSHCPMADTYRTMVARWKAADEKYDLTGADIRAVLGVE